MYYLYSENFSFFFFSSSSSSSSPSSSFSLLPRLLSSTSSSFPCYHDHHHHLSPSTSSSSSSYVLFFFYIFIVDVVVVVYRPCSFYGQVEKTVQSTERTPLSTQLLFLPPYTGPDQNPRDVLLVGLVGKKSVSRAADLGLIPVLAVDLFPCRVIPVA